MKKHAVKYAIPCAFSDHDDFDVDSLFFVTFNTDDENEAIKLASCVCGKGKAAKALVIINDEGEIFYI